MEYLRPEDYEYISNKYHDTKKPFNAHQRFIRHDEIFSADSGASAEEIMSGILENDKKYENESHPVRKARGIEFVLKNTRISCDSRDIFPAINMVDRPLDSTLVKEWKKEVFGNIIADVEAERARIEDDGAVTMWPDYCHSIPDWGRMLSLGFPGLLRESEKARSGRELNEEQQAFFEGIRITYEAIIAFVERLRVRAAATEGSERMSAALEKLRDGAPQSFYEAMLFAYLYFMISEHVDGLQVRSLSNFDRQYYEFFKADLEKGVTEEELRRDLAYYLLQFTAIGNYWGQPIFLGGENADGTTVTNELSYLFLDVYDKMGIYNPKVQIKVCKSTPKAFLLKALDMIRHGHNSIVFVCDTTIRKALVRVAGRTEEEARTCNVGGCYEYSIIGGYGTGMNYTNLIKPLEYALHEGRDALTGRLAGLPCPPVSSFNSFDELMAEYKRQLESLIGNTIRINNTYEEYLDYVSPLPHISATFTTCLERGRDAIGGGARDNSTCMEFGYLADIADSFTMIQKYVFDKKELTLTELVKVLDANYEGYEKLRMKLFLDREKYGNNKDRPDAFAKEISEFVVSKVCGKPNSPHRGGIWTCAFHVARMSYIQGATTAATPNGRRLGEELSKNVSASMGQSREGATAAILSATKIDATSFFSDAALDLGLLPSAVKGEDGLEAMYGLLMTFCNRGGHAIHINVFDADTLRDAQAHPEKYGDLQIRVCGWNVLWNNINKEEQDGFIRQAESLI